MLGIVGVLVAGVALPMAFGDDGEESDDDREEDQTEAEGAPQDDLLTDGEDGPDDGESPLNREIPSPESESPLSVALSDAETGGTGADPSAPLDPFAQEAPPTLPDPAEEDDDILRGTEEADISEGGGGSDLFLAADDDDTAGGGTGPDKLQGGRGNDLLWGDFGDDHLAGEPGDDILVDGAGDDTLDGGDGNDTLNATTADGEWESDGRDELHGGAGDDVLVLSKHDYATGGSGGDTFYVGEGLGPFVEGQHPQIGDFEPGQDSLIVVWNDYAADTPPQLEITADQEDPDLAQVLADGEVVASIGGTPGLSLNDIRLLGTSQLV